MYDQQRCIYRLQIEHDTCILTDVYTLGIARIGARILVFVEHLVKGVVELAGDGVDLQLLPDDLVLQLVNPDI